MVTIRPMLSDDWSLHREVRLQSLLESPHAFGSSYERELKRSDDEWESIINTALASGHNHVFFAEVDAVIGGLVWCKLSATENNLAEIFQMWVNPKYRGSSIGRQLLQAAIDCAAQHKATIIRLEVTALNRPVIGFYQSQGFQLMDSIEPINHTNHDAQSQLMQLKLR